MSSVAQLQQLFSLPEGVSITEGHGGLALIRIFTPQCTGEVYLLGAQVSGWKPAGGQEVLWVSQSSLYKVGKAIRGGVPVCFPWFGAKADDPKAPAHGFVRTREWELESISRNGDDVAISLLTRSDQATKQYWNTDFELRLRATFGSILHLELEFRNTGGAAARFEEALHAYFTIGDVRKTNVTGLDGTDYLDKTDGNKRKPQAGPVKIDSETDRVYLNTTTPLEVIDPVLARQIRIEKQDSQNTVVWNPWIEKSRSLSDFGDDEWPGMMCIEPANVGASAIEVAPQQQHTMDVSISQRQS